MIYNSDIDPEEEEDEETLIEKRRKEREALLKVYMCACTFKICYGNYHIQRALEKRRITYFLLHKKKQTKKKHRQWVLIGSVLLRQTFLWEIKKNNSFC